MNPYTLIITSIYVFLRFPNIFLYDKCIEINVILGVVHFLSGRTRPMLVFENCSYLFERQTKNKTSWRCNKNPQKCRSRIISEGNAIRVTGKHNHDPDVPHEKLGENVPSQVVFVKKC